MRYTETVKKDNEGIERITEIVRDQLKKYRVNRKECTKAVLAVEEAAGCLAEHATDDEIKVHVHHLPGSTTVILTSKGEPFSLSESMDMSFLLDSDVDDETLDMIRNIVLRSVARDLKCRNSKGVNRISLTIERSPRAFLYQTLGALALAVIAGLVLSAVCPARFNTLLNDNILVPVKTMYLNALKMVVAPVVFLSIVSCIVQFSSITELGRIGGKVILIYIITTVIAVFVGLGVFTLFRPGSGITSTIDMEAAGKITSQTISVSLKDTIVGIVSPNFVQPFVDSNMLQLIFLAVMCGIAAGRIGSYSEMARNFFETFNELFLKITVMIIGFMPIAVFCSICSMILKTGISTIISVLGMMGTFIVGLVIMMLIYCIILAVFGRLNPLIFVKKYIPSMLQVFSMGSSNASIPVNMKACEELGVSKKIYCLSIPLGATLNMDGGCIYMMVFSLALAKAYGMQITGGTLFAVMTTIIILSMGAPGIPGSGLICLSVLLTQAGIPNEAVGLVMGIDALVGMFRCMSNCTGDVAVSVLIAKLEKMLDLNTYSGTRS
ncbi:MAG: dicarboxylate/amino acid:cation symporter [Lachnospiraceae bacterium]|nr:dicarboxylate/amino acid:cation symporter [Lachnospiraceae bacterium]